MATQASDSVVHRETNYKLARRAGAGLLNVFAALGYRPQGICTACDAGYLAEYSVMDRRLFLSGLRVEPPGEFYAPNHVGELPEPFGAPGNRGGLLGVFYYEGLSEPMDFTGGLILGDGFIRDLYFHGGSHPAWKYTQVLELIFDSDVLVEEYDRSASMADYRSQHERYWKTKWAPGKSPEFDLLADMYADCFLLDYSLRRRRQG